MFMDMNRRIERIASVVGICAGYFIGWGWFAFARAPLIVESPEGKVLLGTPILVAMATGFSLGGRLLSPLYDP